MAGGVTTRPRVGRAYTASTAQCDEEWRKHEAMGGKALYIRLVAGFGISCVIGALFITLGAVYFEDAKDIHDKMKMSLPLVWCISGMVGGCILILGSVVLAKLMLSNKWIRGNNPRSPRRTARVHYAVASAEGREASVDIQLPPAYDEIADPSVAPAPFSVSDGTVAVDTQAPPPYTEADLKPPEYAVQDPYNAGSTAAREAWTPGCHGDPQANIVDGRSGHTGE